MARLPSQCTSRFCSHSSSIQSSSRQPQHSVWQQQQPPSQQSQQLSAAAQIEQLMRNMKSLDVSRDVASPAAPPGRRAAQLLASINSQPIPKLNFENRRRKAAEAAAAADAAAGIDRSQTQVIGIPDVLDSDDWQASGSDDDAGGLDSSRRSSQQLYLPKAPPHSIDPQTTTNFSKLARGCAEGSDDDDDILRELEDGDGYNRGEVPDRRRRQLSSTTTTTLAPSPYSSNASPPGFQVHTPPSHEEHQQVQWPPQAAHEVRQQHSMTVNAEPPVQQQQPPEARRVIGNLAYGELTQKNEHGELLVHKLAREGNWPKVVAFNQRQLSNPSFGDLFAGINTPDSFGRTVLLEAVQQQNAKAVAYCCLFTSSSDRLLLPALAEAALLPAADEEIFLTVLTTLCQDLDVNGNPVLKACNKDIDSELSWGVSSRLWRFSGLTLLQLLSIQSYDEHSHSRLSKLSSCGADPRRPVSRIAAPEFRPFSNCPQLAARFSPDPLGCLQALGLTTPRAVPILQGTQLTFSWDTDCHVSHSCAKIIACYKELAQRRLSGPELPELKLEDVDLPTVDEFYNMLKSFTA
uniref:ANK_REP_REGION domain-containing protein n=1 Tax=Macrostomum lignano TaxID=282301 RepID=A0A1I8IJ18_9PLAT